MNIPKTKSGERRRIVMPSLILKREQRLALSHLAPLLESSFSESSYGFRKGRGPRDAVDQFTKNVNDGFQWITSIDLENCFDNINPSTALCLIDSRLGDYYQHDVKGLPQGHPLSPLLCNVFLDQFDKEMERYVELSQILELDFRFLRYVDDIWLMTRKKKALELYTSRAIQVLENLGFKTRAQIKHVNEGVNVLGFTIRRWSKCPSTKSLNRLHDGLLRLVCEFLELKNEAMDDYDTTEQAGNTDYTRQDQYHNHKTGWTNYYDAYIRTTEQWPTLYIWVVMMEGSGTTSNVTNERMQNASIITPETGGKRL